MKKNMLKLKLSRRVINLLVVCLFSGGALFAWQTVAELQTKEDVKTAETKNEITEKAVSIHATGRGNPFVNFTDGTDLIVPNDAKNDNSQPQTLTSADFDSDGIADLVTADASGSLKFYHGTGQAKTNGLTAEKSGAEESPFALTGKSFALNISPDYLFAGDFNADGRKDILATAKGVNFLVFLSGDGRGNFSQPNAIVINGQITAIQTGEIGRKDGQTDLAVGFVNKDGAFVAVFEHPEGAFKHKPEIFKLISPATDLAIGNLDGDFYADIAVACGSDLTIIHGRGQAYPWDLIQDSGIKRPNAEIANRKMPFAISALTVGRFGIRRGDSLAMLGQDGNVYQLEPNGQEKSSKNIIPSLAEYNTAPNPFVPTDADNLNSATISAPQLSPEETETLGLLNDRTALKNGEISDAQKKLLEDQLENYKNTDKKEIERLTAENKAKSIESREKANAAFLKTISGKPSTLANWNLKPLVSNSQFTGTAASGNSQKMLRVNVSDSNLDDIMLVDTISNQIQIVSQVREAQAQNQTSTQVTSLETDGNPLAVLPMRLNMDALTDLVVLRQGASVPSVVMTAPTEILTVDSTDDTGDCQPGNPCSLRNAIIYSNSHSGVETINFNLGGVATITPSQELPRITDAVNIFGNINSNVPDVEISGANVPAPANGLLIETSNSFIYGLAINGFKSTSIGQSQLGGNGIAIDSLLGSPINGNNTILLTFLGTDRTGSFDKGNDATGLNIFTSDNNQIIQNVISGNGSQQKSGAGIAVTGGNSNLFLNNIVGLNSLGTGKVGNSLGVFLTGLNNTFGGDGTGDGNTVSGNGEPFIDNHNSCGGDGLYIPVLIDVQTQEILTFGNTVSGNRFGTNPAGNLGLGNCYRGIETDPITGTFIGSITENGRNTVSDNGYDAIWCGTPYTGSPNPNGFGFCAIVGNNVGTDISGTIPIRNDLRNIRDGAQPTTAAVFVAGNGSLSNVGAPGGTTPGGECTGFCNLISGNDNSPSFNSDSAVELGGLGVMGIFNNYIGTNKSGTQAVSNYSGVDLASTSNYNFTPTFLLGGYGLQDGNSVSFGNLISGNSGGGVSMGVGGLTVGNYFVLGNKIGTDVSGTFAVPNVGYFGIGGSGINVSTGLGYGTSQIGDTNPLGRNIISGNGYDGINFFTGYNVSVANNLIGLNSSLAPLGNGGNGINLSGFFGVGNTIGGGNAAAANLIQNNSKSGILVKGIDYFANNLRGNSISNNSGLGIDLAVSGAFGDGDGVTPNDCHDFDAGANDLQNFPLLPVAPVFNGNGTVTVGGVLLSRSFNPYAVDFYASSSADPTGHGEWAIYIGSVNVDTDEQGRAQFNFTSSAPVSSSLVISATATDRFGSTSEFSCIAGGTCADNLAATVEDYMRLTETCSPVEQIIVTVNTDESNDPTSLATNVCDVFTDPEHPGLQCTLRAAIEVANHKAGEDIITFNISGEGVHTISPATDLPMITERVFMNAKTQSGYVNSPVIELNLIQMPSAVGGLNFQLGSGGSVVKGMSIFGGVGVQFDHSDRSQVYSCYIGLKADGTPQPRVGGISGISVSNSYGVRIGGVNEGDGNVISGNTYRGINLVSGAGCHIVANRIGTDPTGTSPVPNGAGIEVLAGSRGADINSNVISGNSTNGISISTSHTRIQFNLIGTTADGMSSLPNGGSGIVLSGSDSRDNSITGNTVSGNALAGINIFGEAHENYIAFLNKIGVGLDGVKQLPNKYGIVITDSSDISIGLSLNDEPRDRGGNIISGNSLGGIIISSVNTGIQAKNNEILTNRIGVDANNDVATNTSENILLKGDVSKTTIEGNKVGGSTVSGIAFVQGTHDNTVSNNIIGQSAPNKIGIKIQQSSKNKIFDNEITNNEQIGLLIGNSIPGEPALNIPSVVNGSLLPATANNVYRNTIINSQIGLALTEGANNNLIGKGGLDIEFGNIITGNSSGSGYGILLGTTSVSPNEAVLSSGNQIFGNTVGQAGDNVSSNLVGLVIMQARDNTIGGDTDSRRNIFVSNEQEGIKIQGNLTKGNLIEHNDIGLLSEDTDRIFGNGGDGISINATGTNTIKYNRIGNNGGNGIRAVDLTLQNGEANSIVISGNSIGAVGNVQVGNMNAGLRFDSVQNGLIGVSGEDKNIISSNGGDGILIEGSDSKLNLISNSIIGTSLDGNPNLGNGGDGIRIVGGQEETIGGVQSLGNVISGNLGSGILISNSTLNKIYGNRVGIINTTNGNQKLGNIQSGIKLFETSRTAIGDPVLNGYRNYIGGNTSGIGLEGAETKFTMINGNYIGTDTTDANLGNFFHGILITLDASQNLVGGAEGLEAGNHIAHNLGNGVWVDDSAGNGNLIDPNSIFSNGGLGIDIGTLGHTPNDPDDADEGANRGQNYPEIVSKQILNNELIVNFKVDSASGNSNYGTNGIYVEFFKSDNSGEGERFLGFTYYTVADHNGSLVGTKTVNLGDINALGITSSDLITATATDADNNTSEFFPPFGPTAANVSVGGRVLNAGGQGIPNAVITLANQTGETRLTRTSAFGFYRFDDVQAGETYVLSVTTNYYVFDRPTRILSITDELTDVDFIASP